MSTLKIGHVTVTAPKTVSRDHESAAQYHSILVEPGEYPIELRTSQVNCGAPIKYVVVAWTGIVQESGYGAKRYTAREGTTDTVCSQPYKYELRSGRFHGCDVTITDSAALDSARGV